MIIRVFKNSFLFNKCLGDLSMFTVEGHSCLSEFVTSEVGDLQIIYISSRAENTPSLVELITELLHLSCMSCAQHALVGGASLCVALAPYTMIHMIVRLLLKLRHVNVHAGYRSTARSCDMVGHTIVRHVITVCPLLRSQALLSG